MGKKAKAPGIFVTFEGTEGAGKSTLIRAIEPLLLAAGRRVTLTREPGGSRVAEHIRAVILENPMDPWTELFLYEAARAEHLAQTVRPALERGDVVLCDRFTDSSLAYQGMARGLDWTQVQKLNQIATQGLKPALTVFVDIDPRAGLARASDQNRFEDEGVAFQERVRKGFLKAMRQQPRRWWKIRANSGTPDAMAQAVYKEIARRFFKR